MVRGSCSLGGCQVPQKGRSSKSSRYIFLFSAFFDNENEGAMDIDRVTFTAKALHQRTDRIFTNSANVRFHLGLVRLKLADLRVLKAQSLSLSTFFFVLSFLAACNLDFTITTS